MTHLPGLRAKDLIKFLLKLGFVSVRQKGSHIFFQHRDGRVTLVPRHSNEEIGKGLLRQILREIKINPDDFLKQF